MSQESTIDSVHYSKAAHQQRRNNDNKRGTSQTEEGKEEKRRSHSIMKPLWGI
jgi:hypothetical protein